MRQLRAGGCKHSDNIQAGLISIDGYHPSLPVIRDSLSTLIPPFLFPLPPLTVAVVEWYGERRSVMSDAEAYLSDADVV